MSLAVENIIIKSSNISIINNISFTLKQGETLAIIGPSGSGKTTLIKAILGVTEHFDVSGRIVLNRQFIQDNNNSIIPLNKRNFGYIPQDLALWPHLTVRDTADLAMKLAQNGDQRWAECLISSLNLNGLEKKKPHQLSGGQKQRLALLRALVIKPRLLVLDEPFSGLDVVLKAKLIKLIKDLHAQLSFMMIFISHDLKETFALGQKIMILEQGNLLWLGQRNDLKDKDFSNNWNPMTALGDAPLETCANYHDNNLNI